jgi:hypothetical protein
MYSVKDMVAGSWAHLASILFFYSVVDRIMVLKYVYIPILKTCDYVTLQAEGLCRCDLVKRI